jgi:hypothetical protein
MEVICDYGNSNNCERLTPDTLSLVVVAQLLKWAIKTAATTMINFLILNIEVIFINPYDLIKW